MASIDPFLKPRILISGNLVGSAYDGYDITRNIVGWKHKHRAQGGYWSAGFSMQGSLQEMLQVFDNWLGFKVREVTWGLPTWEGMIYEIDLSYHGMRRRRSLDLMYNHITVLYNDDEGEEQATAAGTVDDSISHFGRRELVHTADSLSATAAVALRDTLLKSWGWPMEKPVGAAPRKPGEPVSLDWDTAVVDIQCSGLIHTANWRMEQVGDGSQDNLSDWISEIVDTDCEFLAPGLINANTLQVYKASSQPRRCWDVIQSLVKVGDGDGDPYRCYCGIDGMVFYEKISKSVQYYLRDGLLMSAGGQSPINPWIVQPGVVWNADISHGRRVYGDWLEDSSLFYPDEIEVDWDGNIRLSTSLFDEADMLIEQLEALRGLFEPD